VVKSSDVQLNRLFQNLLDDANLYGGMAEIELVASLGCEADAPASKLIHRDIIRCGIHPGR